MIYNMKIGFPNYPRSNLLSEIKWIGDNGFDFVDLCLEEDAAVPEKIDIKKTKKLLEKYGLGVTGHTAWYLETGSPIKSVRDNCVSESIRYFKVFEELGVEYVTFHGYWPPRMFSDEEGIEFQVYTLKKLIKAAKKYGLKIMYESTGNKSDGLKNVAKILERVSGLYFHLDIGHVNLFDRTPKSFIRKFHKKLVHVHLHDNNGGDDEHLAMGKGNIDFEMVVRELKRVGYDGTITLEIFGKNKSLALRSLRKLRKLWRDVR